MPEQDRSTDRPTIFIGSSSEGLAVARAIKEQFDADADVDLWNEGVFKLNRSSLESLLRATNIHNFAILVLTPDDVVRSRGKSSKAARDNVLFEHGLFLGRLGPNRAFIIREESVKVLSDFAGITVASYRNRDDGNLVSAVSSACNKIREVIREQRDRSEITLLPSTALAIGYFENFVKKVVTVLVASQRKSENDTDVRKIVESSQPDAKPVAVPLTYSDFRLNIAIPGNLSEIAAGSLQRTVQDFVQISVKTHFRLFPFYLRAKDKDTAKWELLELFDIPTTLLASRQAIDLILKDSFVGPNKDREKLERLEIRNFEQTLLTLIERDYGKDCSYIRLVPTSRLAKI